MFEAYSEPSESTGPVPADETEETANEDRPQSDRISLATGEVRSEEEQRNVVGDAIPTEEFASQAIRRADKEPSVYDRYRNSKKTPFAD